MLEKVEKALEKTIPVFKDLVKSYGVYVVIGMVVFYLWGKLRGGKK